MSDTQIGDNVDCLFYEADGTIHLVIDPRKVVARTEDKPNTELVASSRGWTSWVVRGPHKLKFSINVVKPRS